MLTADVTSFTQSSFDLDTGTLTILVSCVVELLSDQNTYNFTFIVVSKNVFRSTRVLKKIKDFICVTRNLWNTPPLTH